MARKQFLLGGQTFTTRKALEAHVRQYISPDQVGSSISDPVVRELLTYHPDLSQLGDLVVVHRPAESGRKATYGIANRLSDGTLQHLSWLYAVTCVHGDPGQADNDAWYDLNQAARVAVDDQIQAVRRSVSFRCEVDHVAPLTFKTLLIDWLGTRNLKPAEIPVARAGSIYTFADAALRDSWVEYHESRAVLEAVTPEEHRKRSSNGTR